MVGHEINLNGWAVIQLQLASPSSSALRDQIFVAGEAGTRCLLDVPEVADIARSIRAELIQEGVLSIHAVAVQAIAFDKTAQTNWKVTWHQDVMFPFAAPVRVTGYDLAARKDGVDYARPPRTVLEEMLAVRLHLDDCDETNGPLRVSPGTHRAGILKSADLAAAVSRHGEVTCQARSGDALLMRPLLLHASSPARMPKHRRVLHIVYYSGPQSPNAGTGRSADPNSRPRFPTRDCLAKETTALVAVSPRALIASNCRCSRRSCRSRHGAPNRESYTGGRGRRG